MYIHIITTETDTVNTNYKVAHNIHIYRSNTNKVGHRNVFKKCSNGFTRL